MGLLPCISFLHQVNFFGAFFLLRATTHPLCPENGDHVRVQSYNSRMVILPHRTFDEVRVSTIFLYLFILKKKTFIGYSHSKFSHHKIEKEMILNWTRTVQL